MYPNAMKGVMTDATLAMRLTPPTITTPSTAASTTPDTHVGTGNAFCMVMETPLDCTMVRQNPQLMMVITA